MKSVRKPVQNHPIMNSLLKYRELLCEQNKRYETIILPQIDKILSNTILSKYDIILYLILILYF